MPGMMMSVDRQSGRCGPPSVWLVEQDRYQTRHYQQIASWRAERRCYFDLIRRKRAMFWTVRVDVENTQPQPHRLWRSFDQLLGRGRTPPAEIDASALHQFFDDKVAGVRAATAGAAAPQFTAAPVGCELRLFTPAEVIQMVRALPDKQCSTDPMPTRLLRRTWTCWSRS